MWWHAIDIQTLFIFFVVKNFNVAHRAAKRCLRENLPPSVVPDCHQLRQLKTTLAKCLLLSRSDLIFDYFELYGPDVLFTFSSLALGTNSPLNL